MKPGNSSNFTPFTRYRVHRFGVWLLTNARGALDRRIFREDRKGHQPISIQQRSLGIGLLKPGIYGRTFARLGDWKGYYGTPAPSTLVPRVHVLIREVKRDLGAHRGSHHRVLQQGPGRRRTGVAVLSAPRLRMRRTPPFGQLLAVVYVKRRKAQD